MNMFHKCSIIAMYIVANKPKDVSPVIVDVIGNTIEQCCSKVIIDRI